MNVCNHDVLGIIIRVNCLVLADCSWSFTGHLFQEVPGFQVHNHTNIITVMEVNVRWSTDNTSEPLVFQESGKYWKGIEGDQINFNSS